MMLQTVETIFPTFLSLISKVPLSLCHIKPSQRISWQGSQTDLTSLDTKPALCKSSFTVSLREEHACWLFPNHDPTKEEKKKQQCELRLKGHRRPVSFACLCCCYYPGNRISRFASELRERETRRWKKVF